MKRKREQTRYDQVHIYIKAGFSVINGKIYRYGNEYHNNSNLIQLQYCGNRYDLSKIVLIYYFENKELVENNIEKFNKQRKFSGIDEVKIRKNYYVKKNKDLKVYEDHEDYGSLYYEKERYCSRCYAYDRRLTNILRSKPLCNRCSQICRGDEYSTNNIKSLYFNCKVIVNGEEIILSPHLKTDEEFVTKMMNEGYTYMLKVRHDLDMNEIKRDILISKKYSNSY